MIAATTPTASLAFSYDADGIRWKKTVNGVGTHFVVDKNRDFGQVLEERDAAGNVQIAYIYGDDLISQETTAFGFRFYHVDGQMSTRQLTDSGANVTDTYTFDAFGVTLAQTGATPNTYLYTAESLDAQLGFYYLRARYLSQQVGRFISLDPFPGVADEPQTLHKYAYTRHDPVNLTDPSGLGFTLTDFLVTVAIVATLQAISLAAFGRANESKSGVWFMSLGGVLIDFGPQVFIGFGFGILTPLPLPFGGLLFGFIWGGGALAGYNPVFAASAIGAGAGVIQVINQLVRGRGDAGTILSGVGVAALGTLLLPYIDAFAETAKVIARTPLAAKTAFIGVSFVAGLGVVSGIPRSEDFVEPFFGAAVLAKGKTVIFAGGGIQLLSAKGSLAFISAGVSVRGTPTIAGGALFMKIFPF
jgi:RHS repeat-associated protein